MSNNTAKSFDFFPWNNNFETGIHEVDDQHREIVRILNQLAEHLQGQSSIVEINKVFEELAAYADYHFKTEEKLWDPIFDDDLWCVDHHKIHNSFLVEVLKIKEGENVKPLNEVIEDILKFLTNWLAHHILYSDKIMAKAFFAIKSGLSLEEAKKRAEQEMSGSMRLLIGTILAMYKVLSSRTIELMKEKIKLNNMTEALKASEIKEKSFSDSVMNISPGLIYLFNEKLQLLRWNKKLSELTGYSDEELLNKSFLDLFQKESHDGIRDNFQYNHKAGNKEIEENLLKKDRTFVPCLFNYASLEINGIKYVAGVGIDISERKMVQDELLASEVRLRSITETVLDAIVMLDQDMKIVFWNPAAERLFGYTYREALGSHIANIVVPDKFQNKLKMGFKKFKETGKGPLIGKTVEMIGKKKDGTEFSILHSINAVKLGEGWGAVGIIHDNSDRKRVEIDAQRETETTKFLLELSEGTSQTKDISVLMENMVEIVCDIKGVDMAMSYLWDQETKTFRPSTATGLSKGMKPLFQTLPISVDNSVIADALNTGQVLTVFNKTLEDPQEQALINLFYWLDDFKIISLLPLVSHGEYLGLIICVSLDDSIEESVYLIGKKKELMQAVANHVSFALNESRHIKLSVTRAMELSQKVETIETMSEISKSILSTLDTQEIMDVTSRMVSRLVRCDLTRIVSVDNCKNEFTFMTGLKEGIGHIGKVIPFSLTSLTWVVDFNQLQYIPDLRTISAPLEVEQELIDLGYLSVLRIPVIVKGELLAVLCLISKHTAAFSPNDLTTLDKLSHQVGVALNNARLVTGLEELSLGTV